MTLFRTSKLHRFSRTAQRLGAGLPLVLVFYWVAMTVASHLPIDFRQIAGLDKILHFISFAGLTLLSGRLMRQYQRGVVPLLVVFTAASLYGAADEFSQTLFPLRVCDIHDWFADVCGAATGLVACVLSSRK
jgi:VanZ family protein